MDDLSNIKNMYKKISLFYATYHVISNIIAIIFAMAIMYFIEGWFSGIIFYIVFIFIFCIFYFGTHIISSKIMIYKLSISKFRIRRAFERAIESEDIIPYEKLLILNALNKVKYGDDTEKQMGLAHLGQLCYSDPEYIYGELLNILKSESERKYEDAIVGILNKIQKDRKCL